MARPFSSNFSVVVRVVFFPGNLSLSPSTVFVRRLNVIDFRLPFSSTLLRFTFWLPLRSATMASSPFGEEKSNDDDNSDDEKNDDDDAGSGRHDLGAIKVSVTYFSDDCVDQG